ncbi:hypothetical protein F5Y01DRAFT_317174 [Xylaria sp. FL0043]|nr:hypothetical protein F5Y01DRAFT_317174 [Xylaria sp. FL0043]
MPLQRLESFGSSTCRSMEESAIGQHCWLLDRPTVPHRQQPDSQTTLLTQEHTTGRIIPSDTSTPECSNVSIEASDNNQVENHKHVIPYPSGRDVRRGKFDYSAMVGSWHWSPSDSESTAQNSVPEESTNARSLTGAATGTIHLIDHDILNTPSSPPPGQLPRIGAAQVPDARGSHPNDTFRRSQQSQHCSCFEQNSRLLCTLKRADPEEGQVSDKTKGPIMVKIQEALKTWHGLSECPSCAHDSDTDIVLLALVCGRELVAHIQAEPGLYDNRPGPGHSPSLVLGGYEVKGDEKSMLLLALRSITIKKLDQALLSLQELLEKKTKLLRARKLPPLSHQHGAGGAWDDIARMDQMMQGIMGSLKTLQSAG